MLPENEPDRPNPNRRQVIAKGVGGALALTALGMPGTVFARNMIDPTPSVTEGPYWVEELLNRSDIRSDPTTGVIQAGLPTSLTIRVLQLKNGRTAPLSGAVVDIWHCNAYGAYSDEASENTLGEKFLRGLQITNKQGYVRFVTVYPGWYSGRTVHVHLRARLFDANYNVTYNFVTQMFFNDKITSQVYARTSPYNTRPTRDTVNSTDSIFTGASSDGEVAEDAGADLLLRLSANRARAIGNFTVVIDLSDAGYNNATGGGVGGGTPPAGGMPPGGMPPP